MSPKLTEIIIEFSDGGGRCPLSSTPFAQHETTLLCAINAPVRLPRELDEPRREHTIRREVAREDRFLALCSQKIGSAPFDSVFISTDCVIVTSFLRRIDFDALYQIEVSA